MRIEVVAEKTITPQARTYAEYRVFAALIRPTATRNARCARVTLRAVHKDANRGGIECTVTVLFEQADIVRVKAIGAHACAAINRSMERLRAAIDASGATEVPS